MNIKNSVVRAVNKAKFSFDNHKPEIMIVSGIVCMAAGIVTAIMATTKVGEVIDTTKDRLDVVHQRMLDTENATVASESEESTELYSEKENQQALTKVYAIAAMQMGKLYAPTIICTLLGTGLIVGGMREQKQRNLALAVAYTAEHNAFKNYREKVLEKFGEEIDRELNLGVREETVVDDVVDENGEVHKVERKVTTMSDKPVSPYAKYFDECSTAYENDHEVNLYFLRAQEAWANNVFHQQGYLTLNEVYDRLGIPLTRSGYEIGWVDSKPNEPVKHISFGIYDGRQASRNFVNGYEKFILLDFNVDGYIRDVMPLAEV